MDILSNIQRITSYDDISLKTKSNYDFFIELLLAGMFSISFLSWTQVIIEAGGLICVPSYGDTSSYSIPSARYVASRCQLEFSPRSLLFFPYFSLFSSAVIFLIHISWIKMPSVVIKLSNYFGLFQQISNLEPRFDNESGNMLLLPTFEHNHHDKKFVKRLIDRLMMMLIEESYVRKIYVRKYQITAFASLIFAFLTVLWMYFSSFGVTYFACDIKIENSNKVTAKHTCDVSSAIFIYGTMLVQLLLTIFVFLLAAINTSRHMFHIKLDNIFPGDDIFDNFKGLPGTTDLLFCVYIFTKSAPISSFLFNAIKYVLRQAGDLESGLINDIVIDLKEKETDPDLQKKKMLLLDKKHKFSEGALLVHYITYQLGLVEISNDQNFGHLYDCLEHIAMNVVPHEIPFVGVTFREMIAEEILKYKDCYKFYIDMAKFYQSNQEYDAPVNDPYEHVLESLKDIKNCNMWGEFLSIAATANLFSVNIYLIDEGRSHGKKSKHKITEFKPFMSQIAVGSFIMTFIEPCYYHNTKDREDVQEEELKLRKEFISSYKHRSCIRKNARQLIYNNAAESYDTENMYKNNITITANNVSITKRSSQMVFIPYYGTTQNLNVRRRNDNIEFDGKINLSAITKIKTVMKNAARDTIAFRQFENKQTEIEFEDMKDKFKE